MFKRFAAITIAAMCTSGCTLGNWNSIYRQFSTSGGDSQLIDVKQRSILVQPGDNGRQMVCAEPSPDAMSVYAASLAASGEATNRSAGATESASGSVNASTNEAGLAFGLRTQPIQLLRDAYYRACEAYMSGAIDKETYDTLTRRLNNQTIAYLAIDVIANGPGGRQPNAVQVPDLKPLYDELAAHQKKRNELKKKVDPAQGEQAGSEEAKQQLVAEEKAIDDLNKKIVEAAKPIATASAEGPKGGVNGVEAAWSLAQTVLAADYTPQNCFAHLRLSEDAKKPPAVGDDSNVSNATDYCRRILKARANEADTNAALLQSYAEQTAAISRWFTQNCAGPNKDAKLRETCRAAAEKIIKTGAPLGVGIPGGWRFSSPNLPGSPSTADKSINESRF